MSSDKDQPTERHHNRTTPAACHDTFASIEHGRLLLERSQLCVCRASATHARTGGPRATAAWVRATQAVPAQVSSCRLRSSTCSSVRSDCAICASPRQSTCSSVRLHSQIGLCNLCECKAELGTRYVMSALTSVRAYAALGERLWPVAHGSVKITLCNTTDDMCAAPTHPRQHSHNSLRIFPSPRRVLSKNE